MEVVDRQDLQVGGLRLRRAHLEDGGRTRDLVAGDQQRHAGGRAQRRDERDALGAEVAGRGRLDVGGSVPVVDVGDVRRVLRVGDVVDHHPARALEPDEGVRAAVDHTDGDVLGLGALVVAAVVDGVVVVRDVEQLGSDLLQLLLELVARVEDESALGVPDRERAAAVGVQLAVAAVGRLAEVGDDLESSEVRVGRAAGQRGGLADRGEVLLAEILDAGFVDEVAPLAAVALVGGDEVGRGLAADVRRVGRDPVRHVQALQARDRADVDPAVLVAGVQSARAPVLVAQGQDAGHLGLGEVDRRDGVGLLQRDVGDGSVDGDVLGLEVARDPVGRQGGRALIGRGDVGAEDPDLRVERLGAALLEGAEAGGLDRALRGSGEGGCQGDDADRALGVTREVVRRLALVGDDGVGAVLGERDHVGQSADGDLAELRARGVVLVRVEEHEVTGGGLVLGLEGDDAETVVADGDGVGHAGRCDVEQLHRLGRVAVVEHRHGAGLRVHDEEAVAVRLHDLGGGLLVDVGVVGADRGQADRGAGRAVRDRLGDDGGRSRRRARKSERAHRRGRRGERGGAAQEGRRHACPRGCRAGMTEPTRGRRSPPLCRLAVTLG
ncbi:hypothetical protein SRABI128_02643 [Microbacterium sp. Bi128]|nr:hypothetical protein SRABI128_02643 [Microbacterium sp. Bi128]